MRTSLRRRQQGYLALIIAVLIVTVGFTGLVISYKSSTKVKSTTNLTASMQAYYMALSGIERAIYDLTLKGLSCQGINGTANYTNATYPSAPGQFTVQGNYLYAHAGLRTNVGATDTTIPISNGGSLASSGTVSLETELMNYTGIDGTPSLTGVTRGAGGTTATPHQTAWNQGLHQYTCVLQSVGAVPNFSSPIATRTINVTLLGYGFGMGQSSTGAGTGVGSSLAGSGVFQTAIFAGDTLSLGDNVFAVTNKNVSALSPNFKRSSIWGTDPVTFSTFATTYLSDGIGDNVMVLTSSSSGIAPDVISSTPLPFSAAFFQNFFTNGRPTIRSDSGTTICTTSACVIGATGLIFVPASSTPILFDTSSGSITIGSENNPVILIIDGDMKVQGPTPPLARTNLTNYGFLYVTGTINNATNSNVALFIYGSMALGTGLGASPPTNTSVAISYEYRPNVSGGAALNSNYARVTYSKVPSNQQEQF